MKAEVASPEIREAAAMCPVSTAGAVRRSEWVILAFLVYSAILSIALPIATPLRARAILLNLAILAGYGLLIRADSIHPRLTTSIVRDWLALALLLFAYREVGWFALPHTNHGLETQWVAWDRVLLRGGFKAAIESLGPVLPSILEIAYSLVYALGPFCIATLYVLGYREKADRFLFVFAVGVLLCYAQLPFWPSEPPRLVFPGEDAPAYQTIFRRFNWWMLAGGGIHTGVFPSAHVAGAFSAALGMRRARVPRFWVHRLLVTMAILIAVATVYGRYHYAADALAGLLMAGVALGFCSLVDRVRAGTI